MPVYLLHGFRWPRPAIRIHIILQNLDDAAAEWLIAPGTTHCFLNNFRTLYPKTMEALPNLRFIEQHDPDDLSAKSQPYAYVADTVEEIKLGVDIDEARSRGVSPDTWESMSELRDGLCNDAKLAWYIVVCGDEEPFGPSSTPTTANAPSNGITNGSVGTSSMTRSSRDRSGSHSTMVDGSEGRNSHHADFTAQRQRRNSLSRGLAKVFGKREPGKKELRQSKSLKDLKRPDAMRSTHSAFTVSPPSTSPVPPMPPLPSHTVR